MKVILIILFFITSHLCISAENIIEVSADGKFKNLESALIYIQEQKYFSPNSSFVIEIRGGIYKLDKGISLGKIDSNFLKNYTLKNSGKTERKEKTIQVLDVLKSRNIIKKIISNKINNII